MSRIGFASTDCLLSPLAISPECWDGEAVSLRGRRGSVLFRMFFSVGSGSAGLLKHQVVASGRTMVLSETRRVAGLTLFRVLRGGLGLGSCLGVTVAGRTTLSRLPLAPMSENLELRRGNSGPHRLEAPGYVACSVSLSESKGSPLFQSRSVTAASLRAKVTRASGSAIPRDSMPW